MVWYALPSATYPPIDFAHVQCTTPTSLASDVTPPIPQWSRPTGTTQAIFVATSLQEAYSVPGMIAIENLAARSAVPVTWMVRNLSYLNNNANFYNAAHAANGDDVELGDDPSLYAAVTALPWYSPSVSVEGGGRERNIPGGIRMGRTTRPISELRGAAFAPTYHPISARHRLETVRFSLSNGRHAT